MSFEECAGVHTTRPRQVLSHAHMCAGGKCHVQCETQLGVTKLRKMCARQGVLSTTLQSSTSMFSGFVSLSGFVSSSGSARHCQQHGIDKSQVRLGMMVSLCTLGIRSRRARFADDEICTCIKHVLRTKVLGKWRSWY